MLRSKLNVFQWWPQLLLWSELTERGSNHITAANVKARKVCARRLPQVSFVSDGRSADGKRWMGQLAVPDIVW